MSPTISRRDAQRRTIRPTPRRTCRGVTLLEALLAVLLLALGMVGAAQVQRVIRQHADAAAERSVAVRLAQDAIERARSEADPLALADTAADTVAGAARTTFRIERTFAAAEHATRAIAVRVRWTDRGGAAHAVDLASTLVAPAPHAAAATLLAPPAAQALAGAWDRSVHLPVAARDLGNGRSAWQPRLASPETWLLDNRSAAVLATCTGADLAVCDTTAGLLVRGVVRFDDSGAPDPARANGAPLAAALTVQPGTVPFARAPHCVAEAHDAAGERALRYACAVYPGTSGAWSGRVLVVPAGWTLGTGLAERRVCRASADSDGSGAVDSAFEHPADHAGVAHPLAHQNFLVVRGDLPCPAAPAVILAPTPNGVFADASTAAHQP